MHILFMFASFPSGNEDGSGRQYDFAKHLVDAGHSVSIIANQYSYLTGQSVSGARRQMVIVEPHKAGFTIYRAWAASGYHGSYLARAWSFVTYMFTSAFAAMHVPRPDFIVAGSPPVTVPLVAGFVASVRGIPLVVEIRDLWVQVAAELKIVRNRMLIGLVRTLELTVLRQSVGIVVNSPGFLPHLVADGLPTSKVVLIPNGVDLELFAPASAAERDEVRASLGLTGKFVVAYAGSLGFANDLPTVLDTAERLRGERDVVFLLVGDGNRRAQAQAEAAARGLDNIVFTGPIPKQKVPKYLGAADVSFCTLLNTPLFRTVYPNKVFDGMACARPVVVLVDGVIRECVETADAGICVAPGDVGGFADAVLRLRNDPALAQRYGRNGRSYVETHFDRRRSAERMTEVLTEWSRSN
jgi:glycosyltransferase involved in cell wall biosynthesis